MNDTESFVYNLYNSYGEVSRTEVEKMINDATNLIYSNPDKIDVEIIVGALVTLFVGAYNAYIDVDEFLKSQMKDEWEQACQEVAERNNYGWSMSVKQLLRNLSRAEK